VTEPTTTWLPNLVGGVSIWKLARDLNAPHMFDGRLLVPDTEGSDSLPTKVTWSLSGLVPLAEARASAPADVAAAITDFLARLEKVGLELKDPASGFHRFKDALTVPGLEADGGAHYYFDPEAKKLCVINWGASPRAIAGAQSLVFGWQSFDKVGGAAAAAAVAAAAVAGTAATAGAAAPGSLAAETKASVPDEKAKDEKKEEKKEDEEGEGALVWGRPWWQWLLVLLAAAVIVALILFLVGDCTNPLAKNEADASGGDAKTGATLESGAATDGSADAGIDGDASPVTDGGPEAATDGATDGPSDARGDGPADGGSDAKADGGGDAGPLGMGAGVGPGGGVGVGVGPGGVLVPGHDPGALPHRFHFEPTAVRWRVSAGQSQLDSSSPVEGIGQNFEVILKPGGSFDGVKVQWQDANGHWHQ
jgi:hypothetical protein